MKTQYYITGYSLFCKVKGNKGLFVRYEALNKGIIKEDIVLNKEHPNSIETNKQTFEQIYQKNLEFFKDYDFLTSHIYIKNITPNYIIYQAIDKLFNTDIIMMFNVKTNKFCSIHYCNDMESTPKGKISKKKFMEVYNNIIKELENA